MQFLSSLERHYLHWVLWDRLLSARYNFWNIDLFCSYYHLQFSISSDEGVTIKKKNIKKNTFWNLKHFCPFLIESFHRNNPVVENGKDFPSQWTSVTHLSTKPVHPRQATIYSNGVKIQCKLSLRSWYIHHGWQHFQWSIADR